MADRWLTSDDPDYVPGLLPGGTINPAWKAEDGRLSNPNVLNVPDEVRR